MEKRKIKLQKNFLEENKGRNKRIEDEGRVRPVDKQSLELEFVKRCIKNIERLRKLDEIKLAMHLIVHFSDDDELASFLITISTCGSIWTPFCSSHSSTSS